MFGGLEVEGRRSAGHGCSRYGGREVVIGKRKKKGPGTSARIFAHGQMSPMGTTGSPRSLLAGRYFNPSRLFPEPRTQDERNILNQGVELETLFSNKYVDTESGFPTCIRSVQWRVGMINYYLM